MKGRICKAFALLVLAMSGIVHAQETTGTAFYTIVKEAVTLRLGVNHISLIEALDCEMLSPRQASEVRCDKYIAVVRSNPILINNHGHGSPLFERLVPSVTLDHGELQEVRAELGVRGFDLTDTPIGDYAIYVAFRRAIPEKLRVELAYSTAEDIKGPIELWYRAWEHKLRIGAKDQARYSGGYGFKVEWTDGYKVTCLSKGGWIDGPTEKAQSCASYGDIIKLRITRREL